jgi:AcrR family transcriptional regulator
MPRAFTEQERHEIKHKLQEVAKQLLLHHAMNKISVDDLVDQTMIAKGTFYLFYKSKEILFYDVFRQEHDAIQEEFINQVRLNSSNMDAHKLTTIIVSLYKKLENTFILPMAFRGDLELLMRKIPKDLVNEHNEQDYFSMEQLFHALPDLEAYDIEVFTSALRIALVSIMHKQDISDEHFDDALRLVIYGITAQLLKEKI